MRTFRSHSSTYSSYTQKLIIAIQLFLTFSNHGEAWHADFESGDAGGPEFPKITIFGDLDNPSSYILKGNRTINVLATNPYIILRCVAGYPVEWAFNDQFPLVTDNLRQWNISYVRKIVGLNDTSTYQFEANLTFVYRPPLEPRQQTCRAIAMTQEELVLQTKVLSKNRGQKYIQMTAESTIDFQHNPAPRYGSNPDCNISLSYSDRTSKICCLSQNVSIFTRGCSDYPSCQGFYKKSVVDICHQRNVATSLNSLSDTECINYSSMIPIGSAGVVVCKADNADDAYSATLNYFTSVPKMCTNSSAGFDAPFKPKLYVNVDSPPSDADDMMELCKPDRSEIFVGEILTFKCQSSYYYFSGGMRWVLKRKQSSDELLPYQDEESKYTTAASESSIIKTSRLLETKILMNGTDIYEVVCIAPVWNSKGWMTKSTTLNVTEPTNITFAGGNAPVQVLYESGKFINCSASGIPTPHVHWRTNLNIDDTMKIVLNKSKGWATLRLPLDLTGFPQNFSATCIANQSRIPGRIALKNYSFMRETRTDYLPYLPLLVLMIILIMLSVAFYILWKKYDKWRPFNYREYKEFTDGTPGNPIGPTQKANAMPYDRRCELKSKHLKISTEGKYDEGAYGVVYRAKYKKQDVCLKTLKTFADISMLKSLLTELKLQIYLGKHENVVNLVGAKTSKLYKREVYIATEFCENGNLLKYLQNGRLQTPNEAQNQRSPYQYLQPNVFTLSNLHKWAKQIADGLIFLSSRMVIHGDISAKNILLTGDLTAKICDFGLSHQLSNYQIFYTTTEKMAVPIKWLAPECLSHDDKYSIASDCWAYGMALWEIYSLGQEPWQAEYPEANVSQILNAILAGQRPQRPQYASEQIYNKMLECWALEPQNRPSFASLSEFFNNELQALDDQSQQQN